MKKFVSLFLTIIWMLLIFMMSSSDASESNQQSGEIVNFIAQILNISNVELLNYIVRKIAHITEFLVLGLFVMNLIRCYNKKTYIAIIICIIYAISDEIHQVFVPGRSAQMYDVLIDTAGSLLGIFFYKLFIKILDKYKRKRR